MRSRRVSTPKAPALRNFAKRGFTLIEVLIVLGILAIVVAFSLVASTSDYEASAFRAERTALLTLLETARADALNNVDETSHGLYITGSGYTLFEGASYATRDASRDQSVPASYAATVTGGTSEVVFAQLSAESSDTTITLTDPNRHLAYTITVNKEGGVSW